MSSRAIHFIRAIVALLATMPLVNCVPKPRASVLKDEQSEGSTKCGCQDLQCWKNATNKGVVKQLDCAKDTLSTVFPVVGPIIALTESAIALNDAFDAADGLFKATDEILAARTRAGMPSPCLSNLSKAAASTTAVLKGFRDQNAALKDLKAEDSIEKGGPLVKSAFDTVSAAISGINAVFEAFKSCESPTSKVALKEHAKMIADAKAKAVGPLRSLMVPMQDIAKGTAAKIAVFGTISNCVSGIADGASTLASNAMCMLNDFDELAKQRDTIARALAFEGTRMYNQARYVGCTEAVGDHGTFKTAESNYKICRSLCAQKTSAYVGPAEPKKAATWTAACQVTCGVARTEGIFYVYTDEQLCKDVKNMSAVARLFRWIDLGANGSAETAGLARAAVLSRIAVLKRDFDKILVAGGRSDNLVTLADVQSIAADPNSAEDLKDAAQFFGATDGWFDFVESATNGQKDGLLGAQDLDYFRDEITEYRDESEFP